MKNKRQVTFLNLFLAIILLTHFPQDAIAKAVDLQGEIDRLINLVQEQGEQIKELQKNVEELKAQKEPATAQEQSPETKKQTTEEQPPQIADSQEPTTSQKEAVASSEPEAEPQPVGKPPEEVEEKSLPDFATIFAPPGVLTPKGSWVFEPSLQYSNSSNDRIALFGYTIIPAISIGVIDVRSVNSDTFVAALSTRYGLTNRLEAEVKIPYVYREDTSTQRPFNTPATTDEVFSLNDNDIGDIEFGLRYQINQPTSGPFYIAGLRFKSDTGQGPFDVSVNAETGLRTELPTGSGFWGIEPSLTAIFPTDPAVFYGSISYMWHLEDDVGKGIGDYDPGDIYGFNFGMGLALNEKASLSLGYDHSIIGRSRQNGDVPDGVTTTHIGSLLVGGSYRLSDSTTFNLSLGLGVTEYAPDVQITVSVPFSL
jgi:hypothetical protein